MRTRVEQRERLVLTGQAESRGVLQPPGGRIEVTVLRDRQLLCATLKTILGSNAREKLQ